MTGAFAATVGAGGRLLAGWAGEVPVSVYLAPGADLEAARAAALAIAPDADVEGVSPAEAMARLRLSLGDQGRVLDGLGDDALPASVEVRVPGLSLDRVRALAERRKLRGQSKGLSGSPRLLPQAAVIESMHKRRSSLGSLAGEVDKRTTQAEEAEFELQSELERLGVKTNWRPEAVPLITDVPKSTVLPAARNRALQAIHREPFPPETVRRSAGPA